MIDRQKLLADLTPLLRVLEADLRVAIPESRCQNLHRSKENGTHPATVVTDSGKHDVPLSNEEQQ